MMRISKKPAEVLTATLLLALQLPFNGIHLAAIAAQTSELYISETPPELVDEVSETPILIIDVEVRGVEGRFEELVYQTIQTQPGNTITRSQLQEDINAIFATGYFANVRAVPEDIPEGVRVAFEVEVNPVLTSVEIEGKQVLPQSVVDATFADQYGSVANLRQLQGGLEQIEQWYIDNDYTLAQFFGDPRMEEGIAIFSVAEGIIEDIQVNFQNRDFAITDASGNLIPGYVSEADILAALNLEPGEVFHRGTLQVGFQQVFRLGHFHDVWTSLAPGQDSRQVIMTINVLERSGAGYDESPCPQNIRTGQLQDAIVACQTQAQHYRENGDYQREYLAMVTLGLIYFELGQHTQATQYLQHALQLAQAEGGLVDEANAFTGIGAAYHFLGHYQQAIEYHQHALEILQAVDRLLREADALNDLAREHFEAGQYQSSVDLIQQSLETIDDIGTAAYSYSGEGFLPLLTEGEQLSSLSALDFDELDEDSRQYRLYQLAIDSHRRTIKSSLAHGGGLVRAHTFSNLGGAYSSLGQDNEALEFYHRALDVAQSFEDNAAEASALNGLGRAYRNLNQHQRAIEIHQESLELYRTVGDRSGEAIVLSNLGLVYRDLGDWAEAETFFLNSIEVGEAIRAELDDQNLVSILDRQSYRYRNLQQVLIAQNRPIQALEIAERGRAQAFVELLSQQMQTAPPDSVLPTDAPLLKANQIQQIAQQQNATLVEYSILLENYETQDGIRSRPSELLIWVIQPTGEITLRNVDLLTLEQTQPADETAEAIQSEVVALSDLTTRTRTAIGVSADRSAYAEPHQRRLLQDNYQVLIEPIEDLLPTDPEERVIFIPQGGLFLIPFAALQDEDGTYLIEKHTILTAPSIQVLGLTHEIDQQLENNQASSEVLVVGNPSMPTIPILPGEPPLEPLPLPGAEQEAQAIAQMFGTAALVGSQATETVVAQRIEEARIVHLATHGFLDYGQPSEFGVRDLPGAVALAPSSEDDGLLTASEILALDLNADLVVLSACDTGSGRITGDGVIGLSRSLIAAGTPSVIVSLWQVPDDSTAVLMTEFYRQLQQNPDKAQALRQAMLTTMQTHPAVRDWAAFTLIGEAE